MIGERRNIREEREWKARGRMKGNRKRMKMIREKKRKRKGEIEVRG